MSGKVICPAAEWCKHWDKEKEECKCFSLIDYGDGNPIPPAVYKWRLGECPMQRKPVELTAAQRRAQFAGKRTGLAASYGACGYRYAGIPGNRKPSRTPGITKPNCVICQRDKYMAKHSRSYKHRDYNIWRFATFLKNRTKVTPWDEQVV